MVIKNKLGELKGKVKGKLQAVALTATLASAVFMGSATLPGQQAHAVVAIGEGFLLLAEAFFIINERRGEPSQIAAARIVSGMILSCQRGLGANRQNREGAFTEVQVRNGTRFIAPGTRCSAGTSCDDSARDGNARSMRASGVVNDGGGRSRVFWRQQQGCFQQFFECAPNGGCGAATIWSIGDEYVTRFEN